MQRNYLKGARVLYLGNVCEIDISLPYCSTIKVLSTGKTVTAKNEDLEPIVLTENNVNHYFSATEMPVCNNVKIKYVHQFDALLLIKNEIEADATSTN